MVADKSTADVISLHERSRRAAEQPGVGQRSGVYGRHHTPPADQHGRTPVPPGMSPAQVADQRPSHAHARDRNAGPHRKLLQRIADASVYCRRRLTGDYTVDEFGFDRQFSETIAMPILRTLFTTWFRVEVSGIQHLPDTGAALLVSNHAGVLPLDGLMLSVAVREKHPNHRAVRLLAPEIVFDTPILGDIARKAGCTLACRADVHRLLSMGELTATFPEGYAGLGKRFKDRYKLQTFADDGLIATAIRARTPIVPCTIVGSEEIYPMIADLAPLARLLRLPYFPITPVWPLTGPAGLVPLPSKWYIEFGRPISTAGTKHRVHDDPMAVADLTGQVRATIQQTLHRLLADRPARFSWSLATGQPAATTQTGDR